MSLHRTYVWPYNKNSESAKALADALGILRVKSEGSVLKGAPDLFIINFGSGGQYFPAFLKGSTIINDPIKVLTAIDKSAFFVAAEAVEGLRIPEWTLSSAKAKAWLNKGMTVFARKTTEGNNGDGIVVMEKAADLVSAPLYTQFVPNSKEYRVYVVDGKAVFTCTKDPKSAVKQTSQIIRTTENGWAYNYYYSSIPAEVTKQALLATKACGLDFSGVDIIYGNDGLAYVLEVNTAPWMNAIIAGPIAKALDKLLRARGAKDKVAEAPAPAASVAAPAAAPALASTGKVQFVATFTCTAGGGWGMVAGAKHAEKFTADTWTLALAKSAEIMPKGWTLTELKAA